MDNTIKKSKFDLNLILKIFFIISLVGLGIYLLTVIICACISKEALYVITANIPFSDFAEVLAYCTVPNPYTGAYGIACIYPPLSFLMCYPLTVFCWDAASAWANKTITLAELSSHPGFLVAFFIYYALNLAIILFAVAKMSKLKGKNLFYLLTIIFCFGPLLFCFIRGNNTLTVCTMTVLFFWLNNSDKRWQRELSYLCLAGAAMMKIYPILMIFYLIWREKGWEKLWSVLKTLAYTLVLVFVPFLFIEGGFSNCMVLIKNVTGFSSPSSPALATALATHSGMPAPGSSPTRWGSNTSLETIVYYIVYGISCIFGGVDLTMLMSILTKILRCGLLITCIILPFFSFKSKKYLQFVTLAMSAYLLWPGVCNGYCMSILIVPFVIMLINFDTYSLKDKIFYVVCYGLIFCPIFYTYTFFLPQAIAFFVLVIKSIVDIIIDNIKIHKENKLNKQNKKEV